MTIGYDEALAVQRRHETELLALDGVSAVGVRQAGERFVLSVTLDPDAPLPPELDHAEIEGVPLEVERGRLRLL
jgi:hypothetical protein